MGIIVVGGQSRNVGKTSVVAGIITALPDIAWTALKITQFGHGICSRDGSACHCSTADHSWAISEEKILNADSDTSRFLVAGAKRVWWVRTEQGRLAEAMPAVRRRISESPNVIIESNSIVKFIRPDAYVTVLDPATEDFKRSAQEFLDRADAVVLHAGKEIAWRGISMKAAEMCPIFRISPPRYVTAELVEFVRKRILCSNAISESNAEPISEL
jgi:hypothetical protein